ncbi:MAG: trigger factor [Tannerella sp.]|jgi:trigger factor|nr:trigger factor [Tannerella sp.]
MNISHASKDAISGIIKLEIEKKDYEEQVEKSLRQYRQKADIPGFRKGMVPIGMVRKKYGKYAVSEEVNNLVSKNLIQYIQDNDIKILGQPMPQTDQKPVDFETQEDFEICFDIALPPAIDVNLTEEDHLTYYRIDVGEDKLNEQIDAYRRNLGSYDAVDDIEASDMVKGVIVELEDGSPKEEGLFVEDAVLMPMYVKEETEQAKFIGARRNDTIVFNPKVAFQGATAEIASLLKIDKEAAADVANDFRFTVEEITRHKEAELNQELFDKLFGAGNVTDEETFRERIKASLVEQLQPQSDYKFWNDLRALLIEKAGEVQFADDILKRWLSTADENNTPEKVEENYPAVVNDLKFRLITDRIFNAENLQVLEEDMVNYARRLAKTQLAQYGMLFVPDDTLDKFAKNMLNKQETLDDIWNHVAEQKLMDRVKEKASVETKEVSLEEFEKLFV